MIKEREAVQTIMEHKIKVLVQSVAQSAATVVNSIPLSNNASGQALTKVNKNYINIIIIIIIIIF